MIVKMKRLELLLYHREKEQFLADLKKLGVVHIVEEEQVDEAPDVQSLAGSLRRAERVQSLLLKIKKEGQQSSTTIETDYTAEALLDRFEKLEEQIDNGSQELAALDKDLRALEPWGNFEHASVNVLLQAGIRLRFFTASEKTFTTIDRTTLPIEEIYRCNRQVYFVVVEHGEPVDVPGDEVRLPEASLSSLKKSIKEWDAAIIAIRNEMNALAGKTDILAEYIQDQKETIAYNRAKLSMPEHAAGTVLYLHGWAPVKTEKHLTQLLDSFTLWYKLRDPTPEDSVPVLVENGPFARLFEPIMKIYCLPDYFELDPTPFFAPFFTIFVGLCFGDVGYGLVVVLLGIIAAIKLPNLRPIALLVVVLGFSVMCAGILLNGVFGYTIFGGPGIPEGTALFPTGANIFSPLGAFVTEKGRVFPMMSFALVIGILQIFFAMILRAINKILLGQIAGAIQPLASLFLVLFTLMYAAHTHFMDLHMLKVGPLQIGALLTMLPVKALTPLLWVSLALFLLFSNLQKKIYIRPLSGLFDLYNFISGVFGNIMSYIRLFALGLAGGLLGAAFNTIAFNLITKDGQVHYASPLIIGTILILIVGHSINFGLSIIGAFVHPLRLTFVEFYSNLGFKGGGKPYSPFRQLKTVEKSQQ